MPYIGNPIYQSAFVVDQFSGNGSTVAFTMSVAPAGVTNVLVSVSGVLQDPSTYGVVGNTITFSAAPPSGTGNISCRYLGIPVTGVTTTAYRTVTEFTATASQTTFTPPSYTVGFINVYLNGVLLGSADYTATNGTTVVLTTGASSGNLVTVESFLMSSVLNAIPNTAGAVSSANIANDVTINFADGSASTPSITNNGDTNTGIFFPAADTIAFAEGGVESMRIDSSGNVGINTTSPGVKLGVVDTSAGAATFPAIFGNRGTTVSTQANIGLQTYDAGSAGITNVIGSVTTSATGGAGSADMVFQTTGSGTRAERMRIDSSGFVMVGTTNTNPAENNVKGVSLGQDGRSLFSAMGSEVVRINRGTDDGVLVWFHQAGTAEGNISVSGTTVSYNGGHLSRWSQLPDGSKDDTILKGTILTNLDDMCVWEKDGVVAENEQLNKMKVSDVEGDTNVAGVFVNWTIDEQYGVDDMNVAMTGDMIIRIADGVVVQKGDLLMSAGDGTAKPQGDDIVRSKTVAKVTSNHVTCTYADGSYCVPCVLMAC